MKTFEERYTAWIDGQLEGGALAAFEQELARRAEAGDAAAELDKADALQLRALLKEHLQAPALTNAEFFNHQMRERIDAEIDRAAARREAAARPAWRLPAFAWPFLRLAGAGAACLFVAGRAVLRDGSVTASGRRASRGRDLDPLRHRRCLTPGNEVARHGAGRSSDDGPGAPGSRRSTSPLTSPTPAPLDDDLQVHVVTPSARQQYLRHAPARREGQCPLGGWPDLPARCRQRDLLAGPGPECHPGSRPRRRLRRAPRRKCLALPACVPVPSS